jgi:hypothetical protein
MYMISMAEPKTIDIHDIHMAHRRQLFCFLTAARWPRVGSPPASTSRIKDKPRFRRVKVATVMISDLESIF